MAKNRKYTESDKNWYKLGFMDGENQLRRTMEVLKTTNVRLYDELCRLDKDSPVVGVLLPFSVVERLVKQLKKPINHPHLARKFKKMLEEAVYQHELFQPK